jgi:lysophospholipase L1-like esterase
MTGLGFRASPGGARRWTLALVLVAEFGLLLFVGELIATLFLPPGPRFSQPQKLAEPHSQRIYDAKRNQRAFTLDKPFITNSLGFRDEREVPADKAGEFRVLSLGDSIAEGLGAAVEDTYARRLEALLAARYGRVRVINAAVGSYSTWQEVDLLKEKGLGIQPDVVVIAFFWNDLYVRPIHVVPLARAQSDEDKDPSLRYIRLLKRSRLFCYLRERLEIVRFRLWPTFDWSHQEMIYEGRTSPYLEQAWTEVRVSLAEFVALADRNGFVPILVIFPLPGQVHQPRAPRHMQRRLETIATELGLSTLDLLPTMQKAFVEKPDLFIPWDNVHLSGRGHEVVARALERELVERNVAGFDRSVRTAAAGKHGTHGDRHVGSH